MKALQAKLIKIAKYVVSNSESGAKKELPAFCLAINELEETIKILLELRNKKMQRAEAGANRHIQRDFVRCVFKERSTTFQAQQ